MQRGEEEKTDSLKDIWLFCDEWYNTFCADGNNPVQVKNIDDAEGGGIYVSCILQ